MSNEINNGFSFDLPKNRSNVIKVIGVGGGGSNAINYMFSQGIKGVDFVVCNTDAQALSESPVPIKIQLGASLTEGLGAGANPEIGARSAQESYDDIQRLLTTQTKMAFITAGMGGGTGTGAAPIIAEMAKSLDILTVGIVTMPFQFEGKIRLEQAQKGLEKIKQAVDALIVINNNKLREVYGNLGYKTGFAKADEILATAARGIAEVITHHQTQNIDLKDARTVLLNSGTAIMGSGTASGDNRSQQAITKALDSPLLNDNKITGCKNVLLLIVSGSEEITIDEIGEINDFIQAEAGNNANIIMGIGEDDSLGDSVSVTVIATGFGIDQQDDIVNTEAKKIIHTLEDEQSLQHDLTESRRSATPNIYVSPATQAEANSVMDENQSLNPLLEMDDFIMNMDVVYEILDGEHPDKEHGAISSSTSENTKTEQSNPAVKVAEVAEDEFIIQEITPNIAAIEVVDYEVVKPQEQQIQFDFELPKATTPKPISINKSGAKSPNKEVDEQPIEVTFESPEVRFELLESQDVEIVYPKDEPVLKKQPGTSKKSEAQPLQKRSEPASEDTSLNPFDHSINQIMQTQNEKRKAHLKAFNHKFQHQANKIDEMEKEPAYKRLGMDLDNAPPADDNGNSRLTLDQDSNDDMQLRSNNSFLHDNVD